MLNVKNILNSGKTLVVAVLLALVLQFAFSPTQASAAGFGQKVDSEVNKTVNITKEVSRNLRDGRGDKVVAKASDLAKEAGNNAKEVAKDIQSGTKDNLYKARNAAKNSGNAIGDRTEEAVDKTKEVANDTGNMMGEAVDSVKEFFGQ